MNKISFLLDLEISKYRSNATMKVLIISLLAIFPMAILLVHTFVDRLATDMIKDILFSGEKLWMLTGYINNWLLYFFMAFLGVYMVTMEYSHKTLRQNLITGLGRSEFMISKLLSLAGISLALSIWYYVVTAIYALFIDADIIFNPWSINEMLLAHFLMCFGYGLIGFLFGLVIKNIGLAIILLFVYAAIVEPALSGLAHRSVFGGHSHLYYPLSTVKNLFPFPFLEFADAMTEEKFKFALNFREAIISSTIYFIFFIGLAQLKMKKGNF